MTNRKINKIVYSKDGEKFELNVVEDLLGNLPISSTSQQGIVQLTNTIDETEKTAVTPKAVNEVNKKAILNTQAIGSLASLETSDKSNLVNAINEIFVKMGEGTASAKIVDVAPSDDELESDIIYFVEGNEGDETGLPDATTETKGLVQLSSTIDNSEDKALTPKAVNGIKTSVGDLNSLTTTEKTNLVDAINEVKINSLKPINENMTFYIKQDTGNDSVANGSQEKPFKTLQACYDYIRSNYYFSKPSILLAIKFLTDYTETADLVFLPLCNGSSSFNNYCLIDGTGHNVILFKYTVTQNTCIIFNKITFSTNKDNNIWGVIYKGRAQLSNVTFDIKNNTDVLVQATYLGHVDLLNVTIKSNSFKTVRPFVVNAKGYLHIMTGALTFADECNVNYIFQAVNDSFIIVNKTVNITGTVIGKNYTLANGGCLSLEGRGEAILPGSDGVKAEGSFVY